MAAGREEIGIDADNRCRQQLRPDPGERGFGRRAGGHGRNGVAAGGKDREGIVAGRQVIDMAKPGACRGAEDVFGPAKISWRNDALASKRCLAFFELVLMQRM